MPQSKIFSERPRRIAFDSRRSLTAAARYSSFVTRTELVLALLEIDRRGPEVEPLCDFPPNLVERVAQLLDVEVADDVEGNFAGHPAVYLLGRRG